MKHIILLFLVCLMVLSCVKTTEKLITAHDLCKDKEKFKNTDDLRDKYDECMLLTDEYIRTNEGCIEECKKYCVNHDMLTKSTWTDMAGCRCICKLNLSQE